MDAESDLSELEAIEFHADRLACGSYGGEKGRDAVYALNSAMSACREIVRREQREELESLANLQTARGRKRYAAARGGAEDRFNESVQVALVRMADGSLTMQQACVEIANALRRAKKEMESSK